MSTSSPFVARSSRLLWGLVCVGLGLYVAFTLWLAALGLSYPFQLDYGEGIVLWFSQELAQGHSIYKALDGMPYASSNYPPVAMGLAALLTPIFGQGYVAGRLLNLLAALLVSALIYEIAAREARTRRAGLLAGGLFLTSSYIYHWIPLFRVDLIGLAFAFSAVYTIWKFERDGGKRWLVVALFCSLLAVYTKQSLFSAPAAACLALWFKDRRLAIQFGSAFVFAGVAIYFILDRVTGGGFTAGVIDSNATVFFPEQLLTLLSNFVVTFPISLALAFWVIILRFRGRRAGLLEWYALIATVALGMAGRVGAWENYFFEVIAIASVFASLAVLRLANSRQIGIWRIALPALLLLQIALLWTDPAVASRLVAEGLGPNQELRELLRRTDGPVISEDMGALVTSGKPVAYYTYQYSMLAASGKWDQRWELNGLSSGLFPLVILEQGTRENVDRYRRFTREFVSTLDRYYARTRTIGKYEIYTPEPLQHLQAADFGGQIELVGWSIEPAREGPRNVHLEIAWQAKQILKRRYTLFAQLITARGDKVAQSDHEPLGGVYPTDRWGAGEVVRDSFTLTIPADWQPERTWLWVGWYDTDSGERLAVPEGVGDALLLSPLDLVEK